MRKEYKLFGLSVLVIKHDRNISVGGYFDFKYNELYIDFFKYLIIIFRDR